MLHLLLDFIFDRSDTWFKMTAKFDSEIVVIITGASSGIGQQAAKIFTQRGVTKFCLTSKFDLVETKKLCLSVNDKVEFVIVKGKSFHNTDLGVFFGR